MVQKSISNLMSRKRIVLAVTVDKSLQLLEGYPEYLVQRGWEVHVVSSRGPLLEALSAMPNVHVHALEMHRVPKLTDDLRALRAWRRLLRRIRPTAVFVGTPKAGLLGSLAASITRVPLRVYLLRGLRLETSRGISRQILSLTERLAMLCATDVIAISPSLRQRAIDLRLVASRKIRVLGHGSSNGVDMSEFDPERLEKSQLSGIRAELGLDPSLPTVGYVGRLTRDKGLFVLADALDQLVANGVKINLLIVGGIDDPSGAEALARLRQLSIPIIAAGHVLRPAAYFPLMNVLCLPSLREGFGNAVIEASAMRVPVVVSDATGVIDSVKDGVTGFVSPVEDSTRLSELLGDVLANPSLQSTMGMDGRKWVSQHFAREDVQKNYADDLEAIVNARSKDRIAGSPTGEFVLSDTNESLRAQQGVLHFFGELAPHGAELRTLELLRNVSQMETSYRQHVVSLSGREGMIATRFRAAGATVHVVKIRSLLFPLQLRRITRTHRIRIYHSHMGASSGYLLGIGRILRVPGRIAHFRSDRLNRDHSFFGRIKEFTLRKLIHLNATSIIAVSEGTMRSAWPRSNDKNESRCHVIPSGLDLTRFQIKADVDYIRESLGVTHGSRLMVHIGRDSQVKNRAKAIQVCLNLLDRRLDYTLCFVGSTQDASKDALLTGLSIEQQKRIIFAGERTDIPEILASASVAICTSHYEGMPGSVFEALVSGTPIISSDLAGSRFLSDAISEVHIRLLEEPVGVWADTIESIATSIESVPSRQNRVATVQGTELDAKVAARHFIELWDRNVR